MRSVQCGMWNAECGMRSVQCGRRNSAFRIPRSAFRNVDSDMIRNKLWNRIGTSGRVMRLVWLCGALLALLTGRGYAQPVNDFFINAITLAGASGSVGGNNVGATIEFGEPDHGFGASGFGFSVPWGSSVWYRWVAPANESVVFFTSPFSFFFTMDTVLAVYEGTNLNSLIQLDTDDDGGAFLYSQVGFFGTAGTEYRIAVSGYSGDQSTFLLNWNQNASTNAPPPPVSSNALQFAQSVFVTGEERPGFATINVQLGSDVSGPVTVDYHTADGTAVDGIDYIGRHGMLTFGFAS